MRFRLIEPQHIGFGLECSRSVLLPWTFTVVPVVWTFIQGHHENSALAFCLNDEAKVSPIYYQSHEAKICASRRCHRQQ